ncbi:hydrogenase formation protein HypD [Salipaludibacillus keqinensis]|uniref:Hydrogenase formation protein HypD n=1 Tax=Salipaludibacillus keqinensis TaxID=2045207 RepID=A0A323TJB4_9BACI|nr:hydrogenase formation protein HypD [Salipaludibacillus keqinensis]PYZ94809.1 hydrogenase formation protein HypD [Salipaludibacillus keqinensis]
MSLIEIYSNPKITHHLAEEVIESAKLFREKKGRLPILMEVCGSHTMALAKSGIKGKLKEHVRLIAGPGCPVCVTDQKAIDAMIQLSEKSNVILCTFGDMVRVPGSHSSLLKAKTNGSDIKVVYSPFDSIKMAEDHPDKEIIFLGIGFETTIPALVIAVREAETRGLTNFSIWMSTKLVAPVLRALLLSGEVQLDGFLLPGQVSIVTGKQSYRFLSEEFQMPGVITGFEPVQLLSSIRKLLIQLHEGRSEILNDYTYVVKEEGNPVAQHFMEKYLTCHDEEWRGMGMIPESGLILKEKYARFDAKKKFNVSQTPPKKTKCRCGEMIRGVLTPEECVLFNKGCTPTHPIGPCMVSSEGTCAAHFHFMREDK